ncbi:MAG: hypothetical protein ACRDMH_10165 [Solirubrobacterales bacterium]
MPPVKSRAPRRRTATRTTRRRTATRKASAANEPAALRRLNKALDEAQDALTALRKDVNRDVSARARGLQKVVEKLVNGARRDGRKLGSAIQRDLAQAQRLATGTGSKAPARKAPGRRTAARKAPGRKAPARRTAARKAPARKAPARRTAARKAPARRTAARKAPARGAGRTRGS